jgi:hypothetical protein
MPTLGFHTVPGCKKSKGRETDSKTAFENAVLESVKNLCVFARTSPVAMQAFVEASLLAICADEQAWPRAKNRRQAGSYRAVKRLCAGEPQKNHDETAVFVGQRTGHQTYSAASSSTDGRPLRRVLESLSEPDKQIKLSEKRACGRAP